MVGQTVSHYRILEKLGEGGMGVVYKAEDTKLRRTVALKFLPPHALENRERFLREAQAAAALNHPNICTVFEIDEEHGFLAMELIDGVSVKDKIAARPLPLEEALDIATQTCAGLQAAHEKGIVHRDIKSANLMLTAQGQAKIMDFGLAQVGDRTRITKTGSSLGTPAYMSPEQAKAEAVDRRTDIWSLGVVFYEMLAGRLPFRGDTEAAVTYSIVHAEAEPLTSLRSGVPMELDRIVAKALARDAANRYQHVEDFLVDLRRVSVVHAPVRLRQAQNWRSLLPWSIAAVAILVALASFLFRPSGQVSSTPVTSLVIPIPQEQDLVAGEFPVPFEVSPDGTKLVYVALEGGRRKLFLRPLHEFDVKPLPGTEDASSPFFSHDGRWVAFFVQRRLFKVATQGGSPVPIAEVDEVGNGGCWGEDGAIIYGSSTGLKRIAAGGGKSESLTIAAPPESMHFGPRLIPGAPFALFTVIERPYRRRIAVVSLKGGKHQTLIEGQQPAYLPSGRLVYATDDVLRGVPFDLASLRVSGSPVTLLDDVYTGFANSQSFFRVTSSGTLVYVAGRNEHSLVGVDPAGRSSPLTSRRAGYRLPRVSRDGRFVAVVIDPPDEGDSRVWILDLRRGSFSRLTQEGHNLQPVFTPDGTRVAWSSRGTIYWQAADGNGRPERFANSEGTTPEDFSPDGKFLVSQSNGSPHQLWLLPVGHAGTKAHLLDGGHSHIWSRFSPDGRWLAYSSDESGRDEVYVRRFPRSERRWIVSTDGGKLPVWSPDGAKIFYLEGKKMMAAAVQASAEFSPGKPVFLFERADLTMGDAKFDVVGDRFVMVQRDPLSMLTEFRVVQKWIAE